MEKAGKRTFPLSVTQEIQRESRVPKVPLQLEKQSEGEVVTGICSTATANTTPYYDCDDVCAFWTIICGVQTLIVIVSISPNTTKVNSKSFHSVYFVCYTPLMKALEDMEETDCDTTPIIVTGDFNVK